MEKPIIEVHNISKKYHIGTKQKYYSLRDTITDVIKKFFHLKTKNNTRNNDTFWALKDVSFQVMPGEVLGIIGRNGAGKTTLLKILSQITPPTEGKIILRGRVASLLEVGTGFHPELTGRENIFLNGAILGMTRKEVKDKFDEIVDFAEIEKFLDTPVKHYSSGMYMRLAFAVAAHLEPEILLVDEVLAVGDIQFQKKCLGKMQSITDNHRTVLFVSHNLASIQNLCKHALWLNNGKIKDYGFTEKVIRGYIRSSARSMQKSLEEIKDRDGSGEIRFTKIKLKDADGNETTAFQSGKKAIFEIYLQNPGESNLRNVHIALGINDYLGQRIALLSNALTNQIFTRVTPGQNKVNIYIDRMPLKPGRYEFALFSEVNGRIADWIKHNAGFFNVEAGDFYATGRLPSEEQGNFYINHYFYNK